MPRRGRIPKLNSHQRGLARIMGDPLRDIDRPQPLSRRIETLRRQLRAVNPCRLWFDSATTAFPSLSTTGTLYNPVGAVAQGDDYNNRKGASIVINRINIKGTFTSGTTSTGTSTVRISIFRAPSTTVFSANMSNSYSPVVNGGNTWTYFDKFYPVCPAGTPGWVYTLNLSIPIRQRVHFSGSGAGTTTGDVIWIIAQSDQPAGTQAPSLFGVVETFFHS